MSEALMILVLSIPVALAIYICNKEPLWRQEEMAKWGWTTAEDVGGDVADELVNLLKEMQSGCTEPRARPHGADKFAEIVVSRVLSASDIKTLSKRISLSSSSSAGVRRLAEQLLKILRVGIRPATDPPNR